MENLFRFVMIRPPDEIAEKQSIELLITQFFTDGIGWHTQHRYYKRSALPAPHMTYQS